MHGIRLLTNGLVRAGYWATVLVLATVSAQNIARFAGPGSPAVPPALVYVAPAGPLSAASASGCLGDWHGTLPIARPIARVEEIAAGGQTAPEGSVWAGEYDPVEDHIAVIKDCASDLTLAHEYGHALLYDLIIEHVGDGAQALAVFDLLSNADRQTSANTVPEWLRPTFVEYRDSTSPPYGDNYYGSSFNEYFAESFAWTANRSGMYVPAAMADYLATVERDHPPGSAGPKPDAQHVGARTATARRTS
jgi:hypothetical protein